jgi:hypothetical protein
MRTKDEGSRIKDQGSRIKDDDSTKEAYNHHHHFRQAAAGFEQAVLLVIPNFEPAAATKIDIQGRRS